jgi:hypothetical protein
MSKSMTLISVIGLSALLVSPSYGQRTGQSVNVQFGVVSNAREVQLESDAGRGALVGGTLGVMSGRGRTRSVRNGIIGAGAAGALTGVTEGNRMGMSYTVDMVDGSSTTIITDQRGIRTGDCVAIERVRDTSNIRRADPGYCDERSQSAVSAVAEHTTAEAVACEQAKQELLDATQEGIDLAARKVELLCNG